ncbi:MAG: Gfo/Idh/MocA family protein, partial [Anaerolineae bacterium]
LMGYQGVPATEVVAAADISEEARDRFKEQVPGATMYADYHQMLADASLDIVSVCTWPALHGEMVVAAAEAGVKGIVCEKPFDLTLPAADAALDACRKSGTKLIVGHQRRFNWRYEQAKAALKDGAIGDLLAVTVQCRGDLFTDATHSLDMMRFMVDDCPVEWVLGGVTRYSDKHRFGHDVEDAAVAHVQFANGVRGRIEVGDVSPNTAYQRVLLQGSDGYIEVGGDNDGDWRLLRGSGGGWEHHTIQDEPRANDFVREIQELIRWIEGETDDHLLKGESGRATLEIIIAVFESSRRRARVELPLDGVTDNPLAEMIAAGAFK